MTTDNNQISANEAKASLDSLHKLNVDNIASLRPPIWYILTSAALIGLLTYSFASMRHENQWTLGLIFSLGAIILLSIFLVYSYRLLGIKLKLIPSSRAGKIFSFAQAIFFVITLTVAREFSTSGVLWASNCIVILNAITFAYIAYKHPTGEWSDQGSLK